MSASRPATGFAGRMPAAPDRAQKLESLDRLADVLDTRWRVPGTDWRFGVDAVASLAPGVGSVATGLVSAYMIKKAHEIGAPGHVLARMVGNVALDTVLGSVPVVGTIFDFAFKANRRNMKLLREHFSRIA
jgi:hypothetical protein